MLVITTNLLFSKYLVRLNNKVDRLEEKLMHEAKWKSPYQVDSK